MYQVILTIHVIVCLLVVLIVLMQSGRNSGFSGLMGGGGGDAIFSTSSQQSGLRKGTVILAACFMATSFFLTVLSSRRTGMSVFEKNYAPLPQLPPSAVPETQPAAGAMSPALESPITTTPDAASSAPDKK